MKIKKCLLSIVFSAIAMVCWGQATTYVNGYFKSDGTYVQGHYKTVANSTNWDNYTTKTNTNPYTAKQGYKPRDYSTESYNYSRTKTVYTGPRGGQYYINTSGNKVYVPKKRNTYNSINYTPYRINP